MVQTGVSPEGCWHEQTGISDHKIKITHSWNVPRRLQAAEKRSSEGTAVGNSVGERKGTSEDGISSRAPGWNRCVLVPPPGQSGPAEHSHWQSKQAGKMVKIGKLNIGVMSSVIERPWNWFDSAKLFLGDNTHPSTPSSPSLAPPTLFRNKAPERCVN